MFKVPGQYRILSGPLGSDESFGNNGAFILPIQNGKDRMVAIASDGEGWEHVSVSFKHRCPNWDEMCKVKKMFWDDEDIVIQIHPPKSQYVNNHQNCLHLWRKCGTNKFLEMPPKALVGI